MGGWWIYDKKGEFTAEAFLNMAYAYATCFPDLLISWRKDI